MKLAAFVDAELFVLPSYAENFGAVTTEALACGLPVVLSNQVNIHGEMEAAGVATVVECSVDSVASGIMSALTDTALRARIATLGPALVQAQYTWDAIVPTLVSKYTEAISGQTGQRHG
jgi:glycosyltransferase involved in cell wall biosynthesis